MSRLTGCSQCSRGADCESAATAAPQEALGLRTCERMCARVCVSARVHIHIYPSPAHLELGREVEVGAVDRDGCHARRGPRDREHLRHGDLVVVVPGPPQSPGADVARSWGRCGAVLRQMWRGWSARI
jgi:hypothetical protein